MEDKRFLTADDVAAYMEISKSMAYKLIQQLNHELKDRGYITIAGKVSRIYFEERTGASMNLYQSTEIKRPTLQKKEK